MKVIEAHNKVVIDFIGKSDRKIFGSQSLCLDLLLSVFTSCDFETRRMFKDVFFFFWGGGRWGKCEMGNWVYFEVPKSLVVLNFSGTGEGEWGEACLTGCYLGRRS